MLNSLKSLRREVPAHRFLACAAFLVGGFFLSGCGDSSSSSEEDLFVDDAALSAVSEGAKSANPIVSTQYFGQGGNLYKPVSDVDASGGGNVVVLLDRQFTERFDTCEIPLTNGEMGRLECLDTVPWTHTPYSCFANGDRQHWRATFRCGSVAKVEVVCRDENQEVTFKVPEGQEGWVCTRFG